MSFAQEKIRWRSWDEVASLAEANPKKVIIDVYTDWCKVCKKMDHYTYESPQVVAYINDNFYAVKLDAEMSEDIVFRGKTYEYVGSKNRGYHEFAAFILGGNLRFPTTVFMNEALEVIQPLPGYLDTETMSMILSYFAEDHYKTTMWKRYATTYKTRKMSAQPVRNKN